MCTPGSKSGQYHFSVAGAFKMIACFYKFFFYLQVIIQFAVIANPVSFFIIAHGLVPSRAQVNQCQPPVPKHQMIFRIRIKPFIIRPPML